MTMAGQRPLAELADHLWDAIVVGAGPAGALTAHDLALAGARVLLVDRATFPRPKICGCCLSGRALDVLKRSGLLSDVMALGPHRYDRLHVAARRSKATLRLPMGLSVSRERLDEALVVKAATAGARFVSGAVASIATATDAAGLPRLVLAQAEGGRRTAVTCRVVIAATGLASGFAGRELGGECIRPTSRIGAHAVLDAHATTSWTDHAINMAIGAGGYVGAVRLEDGRWNLAAALDACAVKRQRGIAPLVSTILAGVGWSLPTGGDGPFWRGTPRLSRRPRRVAAERLFAVGDAAGYVEPFTGEGMACALEGGRAVVELALLAIERWDHRLVDAWTNRLRREIQRRMALPTIAAWSVRRPRLTAGLASVLTRWPDLATPVINHANAAASVRFGRWRS
jgi:menaquinone-9 beta-reductase